ncbi:MAG: hypothetical protein ACM3U2_20880, partial [Deltaproteobacteria bacterium]
MDRFYRSRQTPYKGPLRGRDRALTCAGNAGEIEEMDLGLRFYGSGFAAATALPRRKNSLDVPPQHEPTQP